MDKLVETHLGLFDSPPLEEMESSLERTLGRLRLRAADPARRHVEKTVPAPSGRIWRIVAAAAAVILTIWIVVTQDHDAALATSIGGAGSLYQAIGADARALEDGAEVAGGETVRAAKDGAVLRLADGSGIEMRSKAELKLERAEDGVRIHLRAGSVIVNAAKQRLGRHLYVQTKDVTISVVGTVFLVNAEEAGSRVAVIEGEVRVRQDGIETKLLPGQQLTVTTNAAMPSPSIAEEVRWSGQAESHMAILQLRAYAPSDLRFEVASVRRVDIPATDRGVPVFFPTGGIGTSDPSRITYPGTWLPNLIAEAFEVRTDQISGPDWLKRERYDVVANIPEGATKEQFRVMLGNLLRDRFQLRFHMETEIRPAYALRVAENGPKFKETTPSPAEDVASSRGAWGPPDAQGFPSPPSNYKGIVAAPGNGELLVTAQNVPMADFARSIEGKLGRPVIDETGLSDRYDFKIRYEWLPRLSTDGGVAAVPAPSIFAALEGQLGLRLESSTIALPRLIIDSIEREPRQN
jgi:uncharacterized protein (TIGR03435 family)